MSVQNEKLIEEARAWRDAGWFRADYPTASSFITRLADALEAAEKAHEKYMEREDAEYGAVIEQLEAAEMVYPQLSDGAVEVMAKHIAQAASDWTDVERGEHEHTLECTNWEAYREDARAALRAAGGVR